MVRVMRGGVESPERRWRREEVEMQLCAGLIRAMCRAGVCGVYSDAALPPSCHQIHYLSTNTHPLTPITTPTHTTPQTHAPQRVLDEDLQVPVDLAVGADQLGLGRVEGGPDACVVKAGDGDGLDQKLAPPRARARVGAVGDHGDAVEVGLRRRVLEPRRSPGVAARGAPQEEARAVHVRCVCVCVCVCASAERCG